MPYDQYGNYVAPGMAGLNIDYGTGYGLNPYDPNYGSGSRPKAVWEMTPEEYENYKNTPYFQDVQSEVRANQAWRDRLNDQAVRAQLAQLKNQRDQIAISRNAQVANAWFQKAQQQLARDTLAQRRVEFETTQSGYMNGRPTLARQQFETGTALDVARLGASLRGPRNVWKYGEISQNIAASPAFHNLSSSLLAPNTTGLGPMAAGANVQPVSVGSVLGDFGLAANASLSGTGTSGYSADQQATLRELDAIARQGSATPGWWESKTEPQKQMILGAWEQLGHDPETVLGRISATSPYQGNSLAA